MNYSLIGTVCQLVGMVAFLVVVGLAHGWLYTLALSSLAVVSIGTIIQIPRS